MELEDVEDARIVGTSRRMCAHSVHVGWHWRGWRRTRTPSRIKPSERSHPHGAGDLAHRCKLEEAHGHGADLVDRIVSKAVRSLASYQVVIDQEAWLKEAEAPSRLKHLSRCGRREAYDRSRVEVEDENGRGSTTPTLV